MTNAHFEILKNQKTARKVRFSLPQQSQQSQQNQLSQRQKLELCLQAYFQEYPQDLPYQPRLENVSETSQAFGFDAWFPLVPIFELPSPLGLPISAQPMQPPQQAEIQAALRALQIKYGQQARLAGPVAWGNLLRVDLYATQAGEILPGSFQANLSLLLDPLDQSQPHLAALVGAASGEWLVLDHEAVQTHVYIREIWALRLPEADDQFAQVLALGQSLDDLLQHLYEQCKATQREQWMAELEAQVVTEFAAQVDFEVPPRWIDIELQAQAEMLDLEALQDFEAAPALSSEVQAAWLQSALLRAGKAQEIKHRFVLSQLAQDYDLSLSAEEVTQSLNALGDPERIRAELEAENRFHLFRNNLLLNKVTRFLVQQAEIHYAGKVLAI